MLIQNSFSTIRDLHAKILCKRISFLFFILSQCQFAWGTITYLYVESNFCGSESGRYELRTKADCEAAAVSLSYRDADANVQSSSDRPPGCWKKDAGNNLNFNTDTTSTTKCTKSHVGNDHKKKHTCLCVTGPLCSETDGTTANSAGCICGTALCTPTAGLYCRSAMNQCSTSGIFYSYVTSNSCGSITCEAYSLSIPNKDCVDSTSWKGIQSASSCSVTCSNYQFFLRVDGGDGNCKCCNEQPPTNLNTATGFNVYATATAIDKYCVDGRHELGTQADCEAAAASLGNSDTGAEVDSEPSWPPGCFNYGNNDLRFNTRTTSTTKCTSSRPCLCATAPLCSKTNGTTANSAGCICGAAVCTPRTGLYCNSSSSTCSSGSVCPNNSGVLNNTVDCSCGTSACNSFNGMFCTSSLNRCSAVHVCPIDNSTKPTKPNLANCECGPTDSCDANSYCNANAAEGSACSPLDCAITVNEMFEQMPNCDSFNNRCECTQCKSGFYTDDCNEKCPSRELSLAFDILYLFFACWGTLAYIVSSFSFSFSFSFSLFFLFFSPVFFPLLFFRIRLSSHTNYYSPQKKNSTTRTHMWMQQRTQKMERKLSLMQKVIQTTSMKKDQNWLKLVNLLS